MSHRTITKAIQKWLKGDKEPLCKLLPELKVMYEAALVYADDRRSGEEVYGYTENELNMQYISDRWNCPMVD